MKKTILLFTALFSMQVFAQVNYFPWYNEAATPAGTPAVVRTDVALDPTNDNIYYVGTDHKIHRYSRNGGGNFTESAVRSDAPLAKDETGIVFDALWNLFYVGNSGYIVKLDVFNGYQGHEIMNFVSGTYVPARNDSRLAVSFPGGNVKIYYTGTDNLIHYILWTGTSWATGCPVATAVVRAGSPLVSDINGKVFYVGADTYLHNVFPWGAGWADGKLSATSMAARSYTDIIVDEMGKVFYIATDNKIHQYLYGPSTWSETVVSSSMPTVHLGSNFTYNNGNLIYISASSKGVSSKVCVTYWEGCSWINKELNNASANVRQYSAWKTRITGAAYGNSYYFDNAGYPHILKPKIDPYASNFVYVKGKKLLLNNSLYYAKGTNYIVDFNQITNPNDPNLGTYFLSPYCKSFNDWFRYSNDPQTSWDKIDSDFQNMQNMGLNTVRLFGLFAKANTSNEHIKINCVEDIPCGYPRCVAYPYNGYGINTLSERVLDDNFIDNTYLPMLQQVINIASAHNIRIVLHTGFEYANYENGYPRYNVFVSKIANHFKTNPTLMAIDLMNEPDGEYINTFKSDWPSPPSSFTKANVCDVTQTLYNSIRNTGSKALVTIGNADIAGSEVWDPKVMAIDFYSPHFYICGNDENCESTFAQKMDMMKAKIYYAQKTLDLPWMAGEIGFSAELAGTAPDMGTIAQQNEFMQTTLDDSKNAGSIGYLWWAFQDAYGGGQGSYYGLYSLSATLKPIGGILSSFSPGCGTPPQNPPANYYNDPTHTTYTYTGTVKNCTNNAGIENAIVIAFHNNGNSWSGAGVTYTDASGSFTLKTNLTVTHVKYYASGYNGSDATCTQTDNIFWDYGTYTGQAFLKPASCTPSVFREAAPLDIKNDLNSGLSIYPNPSQGFITILNESKKLKQVEVLNALGQRLFFESDINKNSYSLTISSAESFVIIRVTDESGAVQSKKCIIVN